MTTPATEIQCDTCRGLQAIEYEHDEHSLLKLCRCVDPCSTCAGEGRVPAVDDKGYDVLKPCPTCLDVRLWMECFNRAKVPAQLYGATLNTYEPKTDAQVKARQRMRNLAKFWKPKGAGALLAGPAGVGKTHLAQGAMRRVVRLGVKCLFIRQRDIIEGFKSRFDREGLSASAYRDHLAKVPFLVLDELAACETDWQRERMTDLVESRYNSKNTTICTTNALPSPDPERPYEPVIDDLFGPAGARSVSRLVEMCPLVVVYGPDYRRVKAELAAQGAA